jgi:hypothetical protein
MGLDGMKGGNNDDDSLNETAKRFLELYNDKSKDFQRYFAILVGASLFLLIFMLFPFVSTQYMQYTIPIQRDNISKSIERVESNLTSYQQANNGMANLYESISSGTESLRNFIKGLNTAGPELNTAGPELNTAGPEQNDPFPFEQQQSPIITDPMAVSEYPECSRLLPTNNTSSTNEDWVECNVHAKVREQFQYYNETLSNMVVKPLQQLDNKSQEVIGITEFIDDTKALQQKFNQTLDENPKFWHTVQGKGGFYVDLNSTVEDFWDKYKSKIENQNSTLQVQLSELEDNKTKLDNKFSTYNNRLGNITKSLEEFESPIGKLTIGFDDLVMFFPLASASGFLVVTSMLIGAMKFRRDYLNFHPRKDSMKGSLSSQDIARTAPLWVDHEDSGQNKIGRFAILFLPILIYVTACSIIFFSWWGIPESSIGDIPESSIGDIPDYRPIFAGAYLICGLLVFPYSYLKIIREYKQK